MTKSQEKRRWEHFQHGADIGVRGRGETLSRAFEQAAMALTGVVTDPDAVRRDLRVEVHCAAPDRELLLVDWLNALIYEMATRQMLFSQFQVTLEDGALSGALWGEAVDVPRHQPAVEIKGATYTELKVARLADSNWVAQCVVDV